MSVPQHEHHDHDHDHDHTHGADGHVHLRVLSPAASAKKAPVLEEWPVSEKLAAEKELLGMYVSGHPLQPFEALLSRYALHTVAELGGLENRAMARIGGLVSAIQEGVSKKSGKKYALVTVEDLTGTNAGNPRRHRLSPSDFCHR